MDPKMGKIVGLEISFFDEQNAHTNARSPQEMDPKIGNVPATHGKPGKFFKNVLRLNCLVCIKLSLDLEQLRKLFFHSDHVMFLFTAKVFSKTKKRTLDAPSTRNFSPQTFRLQVLHLVLALACPPLLHDLLPYVSVASPDLCRNP